jgi:uncharacterized protein YlxW (UPF0749 family)
VTEERIFRLESEVSNLREENASLAASVRHLTESVDGLTTVLNEMKSTMDKGRGALWVIVAASTFLGGIISALVNKLTS